MNKFKNAYYSIFVLNLYMLLPGYHTETTDYPVPRQTCTISDFSHSHIFNVDLHYLMNKTEKINVVHIAWEDVWQTIAKET